MASGGFGFLVGLFKTNAINADREFWSNLDRGKREGIDIELWRAIGKPAVEGPQPPRRSTESGTRAA